MSEQMENPYITKNEPSGLWVRTELGQKSLEQIVTDPDGPVYAFREGALGSTVVAAAMARLSRREGDLRETILVEFHEAIDPTWAERSTRLRSSIAAEGVMDRVVNEYGDDSVRQLGSIALVTERVSNLATKHIERGRMAGYLEQSTRYIRFDAKEKGYYKFAPAGLVFNSETPHSTQVMYETTMERLFDRYSYVVSTLIDRLGAQQTRPDDVPRGMWNSIIRAQACDAARYMLPVATQSSVGIVASFQAVDNMIMRLASENLKEMRVLGDRVLTEARKIAPVFFHYTDVPDRGFRISVSRAEAIRGLATEAKAHDLSQAQQAGASVEMTSYTDISDDEMLVEMLFASSTVDRDRIREAVSRMTDDDRVRIWNVYIGDRWNRRVKPGRAFELPSYSFDLVTDYGIFRDLQRHRVVSGLEWQLLSPNLGYEVPPLLEAHQLDGEYMANLEDSYQLYEHLARADLHEEAQYAVLLGHLMRWKLTMDAREAMHLIELRTGKAGHTSYRRAAARMFEEIAKVHPLIASAMTHVDLEGDAELTRLGESVRALKRLRKLGIEVD